MELIGQENTKNEEEERGIGECEECRSDRELIQNVRHEHHDGERNKTVMPVGIDEIMTGDVFGIAVMFTERKDECWSNDWGGGAAESIAEEVDKARQEIGEEVSKNDAEDDKCRGEIHGAR